MFGFKSYQQLEHTDCGLACLRMMFSHFGRKIPPMYLRSLSDINRCGISIGEMVNVAKRLGCFAVAVKIGESEVKKMPLPAILYWQNAHFVVLYRISNNGRTFHIADPSCGKIRLDEKEFMDHWAADNNRGIAILMSPEDEFFTHRYPEKKSGGLARMLKTTIRTQFRTFALIIGFMLVAACCDITLPFLFQHTVDEGIQNKDLNLVWILILSQLMMFLGNYTSNGIAELVLTKLGMRTGIRMMDDYLRKLASLPMAFFDRKVNSDLIQKTGDQDRIRAFLLNMPQTIFFTVVNIIIFSTLLAAFSLPIYLFFMAMTSLSMLWVTVFTRRRREIDYSLSPRQAKNRNNVYELVYGMADIKANDALSSRLGEWMDTQDDINKLTFKSNLLSFYINGGATFISRLKDIIITGLCASFVINGDLTLGGMMTVSYLTGRLNGPLSSIISMILSCQDASMSYERLEEILDTPDVPEGNITDTSGTIRFDNVYFKYSGQNSPWVIKNLSLSIERGKTTAVVGPSGCGKTTLIKMLMKFYNPAGGTVCIGDNSLADINDDRWWSIFGVVMQEGYIFAASIAANIAVGVKEPDMDRVREVAKIACIDSFIETLPMRYNTKIGVAGISLSGGQKQRLFLARALYRNPEILILDEATSSLDANNEQQIVANIWEQSADKTVIIIAHRLSTVRKADLIYFMDDGEIKEFGSHEELMNLKGEYYKLICNQLT